MNKFHAIPLKYKIALPVLALLYALAINIEQGMDSHRYTITVTNVTNTGEVRTFSCLDMLAGITLQMEYEKTKGGEKVDREKMNIFSKWLHCGVL
jgi:hypothetical protein